MNSLAFTKESYVQKLTWLIFRFRPLTSHQKKPPKVGGFLKTYDLVFKVKGLNACILIFTTVNFFI